MREDWEVKKLEELSKNKDAIVSGPFGLRMYRFIIGGPLSTPFTLLQSGFSVSRLFLFVLLTLVFT